MQIDLITFLADLETCNDSFMFNFFTFQTFKTFKNRSWLILSDIFRRSMQLTVLKTYSKDFRSFDLDQFTSLSSIGRSFDTILMHLEILDIQFV